MNQSKIYKLKNELKEVLEKICLDYGERLTGSYKNKQIQEYTKSYFEENGYNVELQDFSCIDWKEQGVELHCNGEALIAKPSYYTKKCQVEAEFVSLKSIEELETSRIKGKIAVLYGGLTAAHLDTKYGTPGALDNGTGIAVLLLLSKLIKPEMLDYCLEILLLNGEDYYSTPGQMKYMSEYLGEDNSIVLALNCDGIGLKDSKTAIALMELKEGNEFIVKELLIEKKDFEIIEPWVEGDHMLFLMN